MFKYIYIFILTILLLNTRGGETLGPSSEVSQIERSHGFTY